MKESENEFENLEEVKKPIGAFIVESGVKHVAASDGYYYHYSDVCKLLRSYGLACLAKANKPLDDETALTPIRDAFYSMGFPSDHCSILADNVMLYLKDANMMVVDKESINNPDNLV